MKVVQRDQLAAVSPGDGPHGTVTVVNAAAGCI